ncbi:MAG: hypothetical protein K8F91_22950, partial [Candidatus Obscuribacterales bacterium]|nr:hypothetical protein [Candidatus Obscuribacterales bacterium]
LFMHRRLFKNFDESVQFMEDVVMADTLAKAGIKLFMPDCRAITSARSWTGSRGHSVTLTLKHSFKNVLAFLLFKLGISRVKLKSWYTRF